MRIFLLLMALLFAAPAFAQDAPATEPTPAERLERTFDNVPGLSNINVSINEQVLTLTGTVPSEAKSEEALQIAKDNVAAAVYREELDKTSGVAENLVPIAESARHEATNVLRALPLFGVALVVVLFFWWLGRLISRRKKLWQRVAPNPFLGELLSQTARVALFVLGVVLALNIIGASNLVGAVLGGAGVLGLAIGFAIRDPLENYFASIMLSLRQPFRKGDSVKIDSHEGTVIRLTSRATILMTADGNHLRVPNATVFKAVILNYSTNPEARITFQLPTRDGADPVLSIAAGVEALRQTDGVVASPEPSGLILDAAGGGATLKFSAWVDQTQASPEKVRSLAIRNVERALEKPKTLPGPLPDTDVRPDAIIASKVEEDDAANGGNLLDASKPTE